MGDRLSDNFVACVVQFGASYRLGADFERRCLQEFAEIAMGSKKRVDLPLQIAITVARLAQKFFALLRGLVQSRLQ
jgi:hypothetical protein